VKYILPVAYLIHSVDSLRLLLEIEKQASKINRKVNVLLQIYIAGEESKFGLDEEELEVLINQIQLEPLQFVNIVGMMGMASFSEDTNLVKKEFHLLRKIFESYKKYSIPNFNLEILSMGMSGDYPIALKEGSNMVRVGSLLFGARQYN
jgi:pyridoxal phosphate enzyme (YggS family)